MFAVVDKNDFGTPGKLDGCRKTVPVANNEIRKMQNLPPLVVCKADEFKNGNACVGCKSLCTKVSGMVRNRAVPPSRPRAHPRTPLHACTRLHAPRANAHILSSTRLRANTPRVPSQWCVSACRSPLTASPIPVFAPTLPQYANPAKKCPGDAAKTSTPWCVKCPTDWCKDGEYRAGSCTAAGNTLECKACVVPGTFSASCGTGQYRTGVCGKDTNDFKCIDQPTCGGGQYLRGGGATTRGTCTDQPTCAEGEYLDGAGEDRVGVCTPQPTCADGSQYLVGGGAAQKGRCAECDNLRCATREYRTGACTGTDNKYACKSQDPCPAGTMYVKAINNP